jgi:hypothetical protein
MRYRVPRGFGVLLAVCMAAACGNSTSSGVGAGSGGLGGATGAGGGGGGSAAGGASAKGGTGGAPATGGAGGASVKGGAGGASAKGGAGGASAKGGAGGAPATGGAGASGGTPATGGASATGGAPATGGTVGTGSSFPLALSSDHRTLVGHDGTPFPILGRASWFVISRPVADYQSYLANTLAKGYDAIELMIITHHPSGNNPPHDGNGDVPFTKRLDGGAWSGALTYGNIDNEAPDFTTPNETYWQFIDTFLATCESKGILVLMFPAYGGYQGNEEGWMAEVVANGPSRMTTYGSWIATRYKNRANIVWMAGGDLGTGSGSAGFTTAQSAAESALLTGITSVAGQLSTNFSAEWATESIGTDQTQFGALMTLNSIYSWSGQVASNGLRAYGHSPAEPAFLLEEPYDEEGPDGNDFNPSATQPVRRFQWWGWLSTIEGYMAGNGYVWPFVAPAWSAHLDTQGANDMAVLNAFIRSVSWWQLVPSGQGSMKTIVTAGAGTNTDPGYVAAAATPTGKLAVAYVPPAHTGSITVDLTVLSGTVRARWLNPTTGAYTMIASYPNTAKQAFTPPGDNGTGSSDWALVLDTP